VFFSYVKKQRFRNDPSTVVGRVGAWDAQLSQGEMLTDETIVTESGDEPDLHLSGRSKAVKAVKT
jgi:hypothetical protein